MARRQRTAERPELSSTAAALLAAARSHPEVGDRGVPFDADDFDEAFAEAAEGILGEVGPAGAFAFRSDLLREASCEWLDVGTGAGALDARVDLVLVPALGRADRIAALASDPDRLEDVARSFRRHGLVGDGAVTIVPVLVGPEAAAAPAVAGIRTALRELTDPAIDEEAPCSARVGRVAAALGAVEASTAPASNGTVLRFLVGVACRRWPAMERFDYERTTDVLYPSGDDDRNEDVEADVAAWREATAGAFGDVEVGVLGHWPEAASEGAAAYARTRFAAGRARLGIPSTAETETVRFALSDDGRTMILAETVEGRTVGPAAVPTGFSTFEGSRFLLRLTGPSLDVDHCDVEEILADAPYPN